MRINKKIIKVLVLFFVLISCLSFNIIEAKTINAVEKQNISISINKKKQVISSKKAKKYTYNSSNSKIAKITKKGILKAKKVGKATIIVKNKKKKIIKVFNVKVTDKKHSLTASVVPQKHWVGGKYKITVKKGSALTNEKIHFKSGNKDIAYVKSNSVIIKSNGRTSITAYTKNNKYTSTFWVTGYDTPELSFQETGPIALETKSNLQLHLDLKGYPKENIKYSSNHSNILKVDKNGLVTAIRPGSAIITAKSLDGKKVDIKTIAVSNNGLITKSTLDSYHAYKYSKIMIVAHPDDETLWGGANLYNHDYFVVCLTNGFNLTRANDYRKILKFTNNEGIILNYPDTQDGIRDDWTYVKTGVLKDLTTMLNYKDWDTIVTYGPDGVTGHIHHKKTSEYVTQVAKETNKFDRLYYFGKFYQKGNIPEDLPRISDEDLEIKYQEIDLYTSVRNNIDLYWVHMLPYENWVKANKENIQDTSPIEEENEGFDIQTSDIKVTGLDDDKTITYNTDSVRIVITDLESAPSDLEPEIDVTGYDAGTYEINLKSNSKYVIINNASVSVTIADKEE